MSAPRVRLGLTVAVALVVLVALWLVSVRSMGKSYNSPERAVIATCHASAIMGNYTPKRGTNIRIGWQGKGQPQGVGWAALVVRDDGGYRVKDCKYLHVTHA